MKLEVKKLHVYFSDKHVLKDINLTVAEHTITALIGPSGCGKSTLLRSLNRLHDLLPTARITGQILLNGENILAPKTDVVAVRRRIGMVFQKPNPFPKSIFDNVAYGLRINGLETRESLSEKVEESLRQSNLWEEVKDGLDKSALILSGGQQQRLCIARAIAVAPEIILMDEPCSALDPISTAKIEELMNELKKNFTLIIVTHNMQEAQRVADQTAFMYLGRIEEIGPTNAIFKHPKHKLTQNYIAGSFG
ncbi:phosphate ABC transporter ATP-binding protein PstB [Spirosoma litoris]